MKAGESDLQQMTSLTSVGVLAVAGGIFELGVLGQALFVSWELTRFEDVALYSGKLLMRSSSMR